MANDSHYRTALVLQGGVALGAYEYGVIKALYESRPGFKPAVVTGISIGAINAAMLVGAKEDPIGTLDHVWRHRFAELQSLPFPLRELSEYLIHPEAQKYLSLWGDSGIYQLSPDYLLAPLLATGIYDFAPLRATLEEVIDLRKLKRNHETRVAVCAVNVATGELKTFDSHDGLLLDHILASASFPPGCPMTKIDGCYYWDGGLFSNTPLSLAINLLEKLEAGDPQVRREIIVVELFPMQAKVPQNMLEVVNRATQLYFTSKLTLDLQLFAKFNNVVELLRMIDGVLQGTPSPDAQKILAHPGYTELMDHQKIDAFTRVTFQADPALALPIDYSEATIEARIEAGYQDAIHKRIWEPTPVPVGMSYRNVLKCL